MARKMRDSGVEWIGEVPEGWEIGRIRSLFREVSERYDAQSNNQLPLLSVSEYYGVAKREDKIKTGEVLVRAESLDGYKVCRAGDIVSNIMLAWKGALGLSPLSGIVSPAYSVYRPLKDVCSKYFHYLFRTDRYTDVFNKYSTGIIASRLRLYSPEFYAIPAIIPPLPEQRRIADYLDEKCAAIDGAVCELKRGIEDCKAWKKAIIFEAVTGKANVLAAKNAKVAKRQMRDSGIPWIGEIPEGWGMECVKHLFSIGRGRVIAATEVEQEGYPVYSSQTKNNGLLGYISSYDYDRNQLTWTTDGANAGTVFLREGKHNCTNVCGTLMPRDDSFSLRFVCYSLGYVTQYERRSDINGFKIMSNEMAHIKFPLPPLPEQQAIADFLDEKCAAIDALVAEKEKLISDLETYKKSLIFELVTGKREVA